MTLAQSFEELATGGATSALLANCKLEWGASQIWGEDSIAETFRSSPIATNTDAVMLQTARNAFWSAGESALFADHYDGRIARLWRVGPGLPPPQEIAMSVAFDSDLRQQRAGIYARIEDHPSLDLTHLPLIEAAGTALLPPRDNAPQLRARAFLLRAFSDGDRAAALFALHRLSGGEVRTNDFPFAAVAILGCEARFFTDPFVPIQLTFRM